MTRENDHTLWGAWNWVKSRVSVCEPWNGMDRDELLALQKRTQVAIEALTTLSQSAEKALEAADAN